MNLNDREDDIKKLCHQVIDVIGEWYNPNGYYETCCCYCSVSKISKTSNYPSMEELDHENDCAYLIAKNLLKEWQQ